ncbi:MAG: HAMP domain-containing sensor histidine kinase [Myxococcota bacterium]|nr:HAMP domain-containing sensor histidine kinase [Myxococcota bacterium]
MKRLRTRLVAAIVLLVGATVLGSWLAMGAVLRPFLAQVMRSDAQVAVHAIERVEAGENPREVGHGLGLTIRRAPWYTGDLHPVPPDRRLLDQRGRGGKRGKASPPESAAEVESEAMDESEAHLPARLTLVAQTVGGREVHASRNGFVVFVETEQGWVVVRREVERPEPSVRVIPFLLAVGVLVVLASVGVSVMALRPLQESQEAMTRIAQGELGHRIDESSGPTELREVASAFNTMAQRIEGRLRAEKELIAGISHELRTPMTRLRLELELLRELGPDARRLDRMEGDLGELDTLIQELTTLSRLELGADVAERSELDLDRLLREHLADADRVEIQGQGAKVLGDERLILRAVDNLLSNADRYAPDGPLVLTLDGPELTLRDHGPGVPAERLEQLFDPFFRAEGSRSKATGGLGLGLMIVRQVAELHGGWVRAELPQGGGLRIRMRLAP